MYYIDLTKSEEKKFTVSTPGTHIFYLENMSGDFEFILEVPNSEVYVFGIYTGSSHEKYTLTTLQKHNAPQTKSHVFIKGVFRDSSHFDFKGLIKLEKSALQSEASLINKNLTLSENVFVKSVPQLEILTHDVKCSHGSSTGPLNPEQLYYLQSRGINTTNAEKILTTGFLNEVLLAKKKLKNKRES